ncbi:hypothetical protein GCM10022204_20410 [Microlunatus aurantiacus]|uniref:Uncharacterized protein n=2 Tax=Microlunatus aurantiacus TaxID=446786 RepID=A0ABP7DB39_9ACTN
MVTAGRPTYDVRMRASAVPSLSDPAAGSPAARLPRPVVWLLWLLAALAGSVVLGFLAGLARPRQPDHWSGVPVSAAEPAPVAEPARPTTSAPPAEDG